MPEMDNETTIRAALEAAIAADRSVGWIEVCKRGLAALTAMTEEIALWRRVSLDLYEASPEEREAARQQFRDACEGEDIRCRRCAAMQEETAKLRGALEFAEGQRSELDDLLRLSNQQRRAMQEERERLQADSRRLDSVQELVGGGVVTFGFELDGGVFMDVAEAGRDERSYWDKNDVRAAIDAAIGEPAAPQETAKGDDDAAR